MYDGITSYQMNKIILQMCITKMPWYTVYIIFFLFNISLRFQIPLHN